MLLPGAVVDVEHPTVVVVAALGAVVDVAGPSAALVGPPEEQAVTVARAAMRADVQMRVAMARPYEPTGSRPGRCRPGLGSRKAANRDWWPQLTDGPALNVRLGCLRFGRPNAAYAPAPAMSA